MKRILPFFAIWIGMVSLLCYFLGILLVYLLLLGILIGITLDCDLIPWRKKKQLASQIEVFQQETTADSKDTIGTYAA